MTSGTDISSPRAIGSVAPSASQGRQRTAVRNVSVLLLFRGVIVAGGVATAALVPRAMGPESYGRYDLITVLTFWFSMLAGLGMGQVTSRQAPELVANGATGRLHQIFRSFLVLRGLSSTTVALLYFLVTRLWLRDLDWTILAMLSVAVLLRGPANLCYSLFLGQGRISRWALPEVLRQWGSVLSSLPGFLLGGLRGAVCGYLATETLIFTIAILGARRAIVARTQRLELGAMAPLLRLGAVFWASELVVSAIEHSRSVLVRLMTGDYAQVGYFGVSYQVFMAGVLSTSQIVNSFVPIVSFLRSRHEEAEVKLWIERLAKWLTVLAVLGFLGSLLIGRDVIPLVLGEAYAPVVGNLIALAAATSLLPLVHVCSLLALTHDRPGTLFKAAVLRLCCFWGLGIPLVMGWGSLGACLSVCGALAAQATYLVWRNRNEVGPAFARWVVVVVTGVPFVPMVMLRSSPSVNLVLYAGAIGGYLLALRALRVIRARELGIAYRSLVAARATRGTSGEGGT